MHDPEATIQDADIEMHDLNRAAYQISRLRKKGICVHGWSGPSGNPEKPCKCFDCGKLFASFDELSEERRELLI